MRVLATIIVALLFTATCTLAEDPPLPGPKDRCPVCGMYVTRFPDWISVIQFESGRNIHFDGPKDMFLYFFDLEKAGAEAKIKDIKGVYITEYYTHKFTKAEDVFFVISSDVKGPMGNELVPVQGWDKVETFMREHGGKKVMQFDGKKLIPLMDK